MSKRRKQVLVSEQDGLRAGYNRWLLLPLGILNVSAIVAVSILVFGGSLVGHPVGDCSEAFANAYSCYQQRYQGLVRDSGVQAAFTDLKDDYGKNVFVRSNCHQLAHVIGRAAAERYDGLANTYSRGDNFCFAGYYHGATEAFVAKLGAEQVLDEARKVCADLSEHQRYSFFHYNCVHELGHGFMGLFDNDLFKSLHACDLLAEGWENENFMAGCSWRT